MKQISTIIISVLFLTLNGCQSDEPKIVCKRSTTQILIDGILDENAWAKAETISLLNNKTGNAVEQDEYKSEVKTCYDSDYLYVAFINHDRDIFTSFTKRDEHLWKDEVVEVFIDTDDGLSTYIEIEISPTNIQFDSYITDTLNIDLIETPKYNIIGLKSAVFVDGTVNNNQDTDKSWTVEMAIPFQEIGITSKNEYPINFYRIDKDNAGPGSYAWSPTFRRFHSPSRFGKIQFK